MDDLYDRFTSGMFDGIPPDMVGRRHSNMTDREKADAMQKPILVTTYATFNYLVGKGEIKADDYAVAMLDEVHRTRGKVVSQAIREALPHSVVQGWTATDTYENGNHVGQELFNRETAIHRTLFKDAVNADPRILCPMVNYVVRTHIKANVRNRRGEDYRPSDLQKIVMHGPRNKMAVKMLANHRDKYTGIKFSEQNSVFYCVGVKHAEEMAKELNDKFGDGYAVAVSGETPKDKLKEIMKRYEDPEDPLKAITNADLLIEGWDSPRTSLCFMLRPTKSPILAEQTGGRVMRLDPDNPDKVAYIMTFWDDNMPDMVTFGDVAGGYHLGMDEARRATAGERKDATREDKPEWMTEDPDLSGMEINYEYWESAAFVDRIRQKERGLEAAEEVPPQETGLMPETGWVPWEILRENLAVQYGASPMRALKPAGELIHDIERQALARLDGAHETVGEVEVNINGSGIHMGRFKVDDAASGVQRLALAIDEEDVETLKEMIEERIDEKDRLAARALLEEGERQIPWTDLREELGHIYSPARPKMLPRGVSGVLADIAQQVQTELGYGTGNVTLEMDGHTLHLQRMPKSGTSGTILTIRAGDREKLEAIIGERTGLWPERANDNATEQTAEPDDEITGSGKERYWMTWPDLRRELGHIYSPLHPNMLPAQVRTVLDSIIRQANAALQGRAEGEEVEISEGEHTYRIRKAMNGKSTILAIDREDVAKLKAVIDARLEQSTSPWASRSARGSGSPHPGL